jgi:hypothetical protein
MDLLVITGPVVFSSNASVWTSGAVQVNIYLEEVTFGNGVFVAVGSGGTYPREFGQIMLSQDGMTWRSVRERERERYGRIISFNFPCFIFFHLRSTIAPTLALRQN